uniref:Uncharacterized protein n=1 Tax=Setaria viridis TaxID=4556 RepID=A0A4U6U266_SETVI|nr:hypothetical protein SEVIR_7G302500v2 [Setaria viridis]
MCSKTNYVFSTKKHASSIQFLVTWYVHQVLYCFMEKHVPLIKAGG